MSTPKAHRLLVAGVGAFTAAAMIAGCSSSKKTASTGGTTGNSTSSSASSSTSSPAAGGGASGNPSAVATETFASGSGKGSKFCNELGVIAAQEAKLGPNGSNTDLKTSFKQIESLKGSLELSAPAAIKGDLTTLFDYITQFDGIMSKAGYDYTKVNPADLATLAATSQKLEAASQNVDNYVTQACGIDTGGGSSPSN